MKPFGALCGESIKTNKDNFIIFNVFIFALLYNINCIFAILEKKYNMDKILIASDHAGFELKAKLKEHFFDTIEFEDLGTDSMESVDYSDFIHPLAKRISEYSTQKGIIICGSGNGVSMTANKYPNVRAALCWTPEIVKLAREHNDANILSLPARFISFEDAVTMVNLFLTVPFEGGRHQKRVEKINL